MQSFGKYQLIKKLATGGMAEVWLARQTGIEGFQRDLVVKRILPHLADDPEFVQMFLNEAKIAARFSHPNIVQIFDLGEAGGAYFIAMEFIHGEDLGRLMRKAWSTGQWIARPLALKIIAAACEGLYYAHSKLDEQGRPLKVIHRDISPQNILISFDGTVKLADFGIAKAADQASMTKSGAIKGKFAYMAPEQAAGKPLDHRSDIYAMGLVLYELLTGVRPLKRDSEIATLQAALEAAIDPPSVVADVPPELDGVVMKALTKSVDDRYVDARQFQSALEELLVEQRMVATSVQIASLMSMLFADRLEAEAKQGQMLPPTQGSSPSSDSLPSTQPSAARGSSQPEGRKGSPPRSVGTATSSATGGESSARTTGSGRRRTGEVSLEEPSVGSTAVVRSPSRPEVPTQVPRARRASVDAATGTGSVSATAIPPANRLRQVQRPSELEARSTSEHSFDQAPLAHSTQVSAAGVEAVDPVHTPEKTPVTRHRGGGGKTALLFFGVAALAAVAFVGVKALESLNPASSSSKAIFLNVESDPPSHVIVRHPRDEHAPDPVTDLGDTPLLHQEGAHLGDTIVLENRAQGAHYQEVISGRPGDTLKISHRFNMGKLKINLEPRSRFGAGAPRLRLLRDGREGDYVAALPGPEIILAEGEHSLVIAGSALKAPVPLTVNITAGQTKMVIKDVGRWLR